MPQHYSKPDFAIALGLVAGKSQTNYPWDSWIRKYTDEPELWFHDIFRADGSAYQAEEAQYIRGLTGGKRKSAG